MADASVTDVLVSPATGIWVDDATGLHQVQGTITEPDARALAETLIAKGGRHIDYLVPIADVRLAGGVRVHAVLSPVASGGTSIAIRVPRHLRSSLADLAAAGVLSDAQAHHLRQTVIDGRNLVITGATGTGKTTLLACLLAEVPVDQRIVVIEDVTELVIHHPHVVGLEARQPNADGVGAVGLAELVRAALRMRPDRLVVGECRGPELLDFLTALNTGHSGGGITLHAETMESVPQRLLALAMAHGLARETVTELAVCAIDLVVHLERRDGKRRVASVGQLRRAGDGLVVQTVEPGSSE